MLDGFAPFEAIEAVGNVQVAVGFNRCGARKQRSVIQIKHADRERSG